MSTYKRTKKKRGEVSKRAPPKGQPDVAARASWKMTSRGIELKSSYSDSFVSALRKFREAGNWHMAQWTGKPERIWIFVPEMAGWVQTAVLKHYGLHLPSLSEKAVAPKLISQEISLLYLGKAKMRDGGEWSATGMDYYTEQWAYVFPLDILRTFFNAAPSSAWSTTGRGLDYFQILGITKAATVPEIQKAWKRLIRQWHPDVCKEPDAKKMSQALNEAKDFLLDPLKRRKYLANMAAVALMGAPPPVRRSALAELVVDRYGEYRPPLRCGVLKVEGYHELARLKVTKIVSWRDIMRGSKVLVTSWNANLGKDGEGGIQQKWTTI